VSTSRQSIRRTGTLVEGCLKVLGKADVPEEVLDAGKVALRHAATVNTERNEVVHGVWIRAFKDDGSGEQTDELRWTNAVVSASSTPHDLASLDGVVVSLERASIRIIGLIEALWCTLPYFKGSFSNPLHTRQEETERWVKVMHDRFELRTDGSFQIEGERPNPDP
jgi:hypothetical protein